MREQETMDVSQDTEITLDAGKLLGLFFSLVILCGISLGIGYWLGRNSAKQALATASPVAAAGASANQAPLVGSKPAAAQAPAQPVPSKAPDCVSGDNCPPQAAASSATDLTFYQAVQQKESHPQLAPPPPAREAASSTGNTAAAADARGTLGNGYVVQIAAVRNQDDAKLLSETLRKQQYPVLISQPGDSLFHVQVGPYADIKEAEAIRSRLVSAGYNPFLKH
jgi:DedD protein